MINEMTTITERNRKGTFQSADGLELYYQSWHPQASARAVLVIVHGHGGHSGIFERIIEGVSDRNYVVYSFDLRGHGRSPGQRGYINSWTEYRADVKAFLDLVTTQQPDLPLFLLGQSMGGIIALDYVLNQPIQLQGLILMSPALGLGISPWKLLIGRILSSALPHFALNTSRDFTSGSRDPEMIATYSGDRLRHRQGTARLATELLQTIDWVNARAKELQIPLLILHGGADRITPLQSSQKFFAGVTQADKKICEYPDSYHELQNDLNYKEVLADMIDWIEQHLEVQQ